MPVSFKNGVHGLDVQPFALPKEGENKDNPVADAGARLAAQLQRVGWDVPDLEVEFRTRTSNQDFARKLSEVRGVEAHGPFCIKFNDRADAEDFARRSLSEVVMAPGIRLRYEHSFGDGFKATVESYKGDDWFKDGAEFANDFGGLDRPLQGPALEASTAVAVDFLDRLAKRLEALPSAPGHDASDAFGDANLKSMAHVERIPAPSDFPKLYAWLQDDDLKTVAGTPRGEEAGSDTVLPGNGWRLSPSRPGWSKQMHDLAFNGYSYAATTPEARAGHVVHGNSSDFAFPVEISLQHLNDVHVVDNAAFRKHRDHLVDQAEAAGRERINNRELDDAIAATAETIVPASEYKGGFEEPIYLISRRLKADEAKLLKGRIVHRDTEDASTVRIEDESGLVVPLFDGNAHGSDRRHAAEIARWAAYYAGDVWRNRIVHIDETAEQPTSPRM